MTLQQVYQAISLALGVVTFVLLYKSYQLGAHVNNLNAQIARLTAHNERMREYGRHSKSLSYEYVDTVLLGPRNSGKSSLAQLWSSPWTNIHDIAPSATWSIEEFSLHEFGPQKRFDDTFEVERQFEPVLRVRVRDYPGEDAYRVRAIRDIKQLERRVVLVFVLKVGFNEGSYTEVTTNASYYSKAILDEIEVVLGKIGASVARAVVVFGKCDLAPDQLSEKEMLELLRKENKSALARIESTFGGMIDYLPVSAHTNRNVVKLLGLIARTAIQDSGDDERLDLALEAIEARIRRA